MKIRVPFCATAKYAAPESCARNTLSTTDTGLPFTASVPVSNGIACNSPSLTPTA